jgi:hypothetical protein
MIGFDDEADALFNRLLLAPASGRSFILSFSEILNIRDGFEICSC